MRNYIRDRDPVQQANPIQRILAMSTSITQPAIFRTETKFEERQTCVTFTIQLKVNEVTIIINFKFQCNKSLLIRLLQYEVCYTTIPLLLQPKLPSNRRIFFQKSSN